MSELPTGWVRIAFEDSVNVISDRGSRIKQKNYLSSGKIPVVDQGEGLIGGYTDDIDAKVSSPPPVIVFGDHTRRFKLVKFTFAVGADGVKLFSPTPAWNSEFLFLQLGIIDLEDRGYGRHYQHLRKESLILAPAAEQSRIVDKLEELLSDLDAGVAELKAAQKKLAKCRQSLLNAAVQNHTYPKMTLGNLIISIGQGWSPKCEDRTQDSENRWAVMRTTAIQPLQFVDSHNKALPLNLKPREHLELKPGDLLITRAGPRNRVGIACLVKKTRPKLILCDKAYRLHCNEELISPSFLELALNAPHMLQKINELKTGINDSGVNLTQDRFLALEIPVPSIEEQYSIVEYLNNQVQLIQTQEDSIEISLKQSLAQRQNILRAAFAGQLVPQDPNDEPASVLLERIRAERASQAPMKKPRGRKSPQNA